MFKVKTCSKYFSSIHCNHSHTIRASNQMSFSSAFSICRSPFCEQWLSVQCISKWTRPSNQIAFAMTVESRLGWDISIPVQNRRVRVPAIVYYALECMDVLMLCALQGLDWLLRTQLIRCHSFRSNPDGRIGWLDSDECSAYLKASLDDILWH